MKAALEKVSFVVAAAVTMESGEISTVRLNLLRVPSFLAVNAATSSTGGTCGLPARFGSAPSSAPSVPVALPAYIEFLFLGMQQQQPLTLIWVAARVTVAPLCPCLSLALVPPSPLPWSKATHLFT